MPSTYSPNLKIELIAAGEQDGSWGSSTNTNLGTALEQAITGSGTVTFASADVTLGFASSNAAQDFRNIRLILDGVTAGARNLIVPNIEKLYFIHNTTANTVTVKTAAGTGVAVPTNARSIVFVDGVNVVEGLSHFNSLTAVSPAFSGIPTAPTALPGSNTTQIATTAFTTGAINDAVSSLGSMANQYSNNVNITGGSITGITDLAVADGGTGASNPTNARANLGLVIGTNVPSPTGTGASGTWGIDISGNAATATNASSLSTKSGLQPVYGMRAFASFRDSGSGWTLIGGAGITGATYGDTGDARSATVTIAVANRKGDANYGVLITVDGTYYGQRYGTVYDRTNSTFQARFSDDPSLNAVEAFSVAIIY